MSDIIHKIPLPQDPFMYETYQEYFMLSKDIWSNSAPATYSIIMDSTEENTNYEVIGLVSTGDDEADKVMYEQYHYIDYEFSSDGILTFIAVHQRPSVDINIILSKIVEPEDTNDQ